MSSSHEERAGGYLALGLAGAQESKKKKKSLHQHCNLEAVMAIGLLHRLPQPM